MKYRLYPASEGGRKVTFQHLRCDFMYAGDDPQKDGIFMIHPEFLDEHNAPIGEDVIIPLTGRASMWILSPEMRSEVHRSRAAVGVRGHLMEGARKVADVEIDAIAGLHEALPRELGEGFSRPQPNVQGRLLLGRLSWLKMSLTAGLCDHTEESRW
ncbi:MAG: hypothetical protein V4794_20495 [Pseudomonadota bacterium]